MPHGTFGIEIPERGESALGCFRAKFCVLGAELRRGVEQRPVEDALMKFTDRALGLLPCGDQLVGVGPPMRERPEDGFGQEPLRVLASGIKWVRLSWKSWMRCSSTRR